MTVTFNKYEDHFNKEYMTLLEIKGRNKAKLYAEKARIQSQGDDGPIKKDDYQAFLEFSKKASQAIARSWLKGDDEKNPIKEALLYGTQADIKKAFKQEGADIDGFFAPLKVVVTVCWNCYSCGFHEKPEEQTPTLELSIPYPPKPNGISDEQLEAWANNSDEEVYHPDIPFMPMPC